MVNKDPGGMRECDSGEENKTPVAAGVVHKDPRQLAPQQEGSRKDSGGEKATRVRETRPWELLADQRRPRKCDRGQ